VNLLFARLLGANGSGELYYTINNFSVITLLVSLSLEAGITYFLSKKEIDEKELVTLSFLWSIIAAIIATTLLFLFKNNFFSFSQYNTPLYSFLFIAGTLLTTFFSALFYGRQNFLYPHLIPAIVNFAILLSCGGLLLTREKDNNLLVKIFFIGFLVTGLILSILYHIKYSLQLLFQKISQASFKKLFYYSGLAFITNIIAFFAYRIDYWILKSFSSQITDAALGNYIQVTKLVQLFLFAPTIIATIAFPASASGADKEFNKNLKKSLGQLLLLNTLACGIIIAVGKWLFIFLYGNSFSLMYMCFVYSIPAILAITIVRVLSSYFAGTNRIRYNLAGCLVALSIITLLNFLLIPLMGINGSALADSAGYIAYMSLLLFFFSKERQTL
jgi:O-antigen/teichoic acid export membrane protein